MMCEVARNGQGWRIAKMAKICMGAGVAAAGGGEAVPGSTMGMRGRGEVPPWVKAACSEGWLFACDGMSCG
jgi:hypothetical protein